MYARRRSGIEVVVTLSIRLFANSVPRICKSDRVLRQ